VATAQEVVLSVWGSVRRDFNDLLIDAYIQIPESTVNRYMTTTIPFAGGLVARLRPRGGWRGGGSWGSPM
jgi:hypothetical protein